MGRYETLDFSALSLYPTLAVLVAIQVGSRPAISAFPFPCVKFFLPLFRLKTAIKQKTLSIRWYITLLMRLRTYAGLIGIGLGITASFRRRPSVISFLLLIELYFHQYMIYKLDKYNFQLLFSCTPCKYILITRLCLSIFYPVLNITNTSVTPSLA